MCYNSFHVAEVILNNLHTQPLIEGHKAQNLFHLTLTHAWKLHSSTVIVPPWLPWVFPAPWEVWQSVGCLGSILGAGNHSHQLNDGWESSPACRENCQQTEEFNPILLKAHFRNLSPTDISSVWFLCLPGLLYLGFFLTLNIFQILLSVSTNASHADNFSFSPSIPILLYKSNINFLLQFCPGSEERCI